MKSAIVAAALLLVSASVEADCPPCGPMQCLDDPAFPALRKAKKARLAQAGFSSARVALIDNDGACRLCLENGPDWFTIMVVRPNGSIEVKSWTQEQEQYAKQDLQSGKAKSAWVMYAQKRCACCGEKPAEQRPGSHALDVEVARPAALKSTPHVGGFLDGKSTRAVERPIRARPTP